MSSFNLDEIPEAPLRVLCDAVLKAAEQFYANDVKESKEDKQWQK